jgi:uncharacterized protein
MTMRIRARSTFPWAGAMRDPKTSRLNDIFPELERLLTRGNMPPAQFALADIRCEMVWVAMRDGTRLATDLYLPPSRPAPVVVVRTPYGRGVEQNGMTGALVAFARRGYVAVAQDCRGTGDSEPDSWDYYVFESEDGYDLIDWITRQDWYGGFIGSFGGSYLGQTQWCMAQHPAMSAILPNVSGLGIAPAVTARTYMFLNAYAHSIGKGAGKVPVPYTDMERVYEEETMAGGFFNEPLRPEFPASVLRRYPDLPGMAFSQAQRWLWQQYCTMSCAQRAAFLQQALGVKSIDSVNTNALPSLFGHWISQDAQTIPGPGARAVCRAILAPPLMRTGWYDWCLDDALATWEALRRHAHAEVATRARLLITPYAHNAPGYHEGVAQHPELLGMQNLLNLVGLMLRWYEVVAKGKTDSWPTVVYYLMGANEWRAADDWPVPDATPMRFYLGSEGALSAQPPQAGAKPDRYIYDPNDPTPTVGGSIVSYVYPPGSVDVSEVQRRPDVLVYTTEPLMQDLDVAGPLRLILYASSSAPDTDFVGRLSDVFPDGRAIQLQSGILRARYRDRHGEPALLEPGRIFRLEIDLWATANRFRAGHRLRVDISSADFPHYDRNSNRGGQPGEPSAAQQTIYHDAEHPSHLLVHRLSSYPSASDDLKGR